MQERYSGEVFDFGKGYGFITPKGNAYVFGKKKRKVFFHIKDIEKDCDTINITKGTKVTFSVIIEEKGPRAVAVRDFNDEIFRFKPIAKAHAGRGRRVGVVTRWCGGYGFLQDQADGTSVFVSNRNFRIHDEMKYIPRALAPGQMVDYMLEYSEKGPMAVDVTGTNGAMLFEVKAPPLHKPSSKPKAKPKVVYYDDDY